MNYKELNDYELVYLIKENDEVAYQLMRDKYRYLIEKMSSKYHNGNKNIGIDKEDLLQEGLLAFEIALNNYNPDTSLFYTYVIVCVKREMERLIKHARRYKNMILTDAYSLSTPLTKEEDLFLDDVIEDKKYNTEENFDVLIYSQLLEQFKYKLESPHSYIFELKINNFSNKEIASLLDLSYKKVDNSLAYLKRTLRKYLDSVYH